MNGEQIRLAAENHLEDEEISEQFALKIINECIIMDLGKEARIEDTAEIVAEANTFYNLPANLLEIFEIGRNVEPYYGAEYRIQKYRGEFDIRNGKIRFPTDGTYNLWYFALPPAITSLNDTPQVHELLHYPISLYLAARAKSFEDEENPDTPRLMAEYQLYRSRAIEDFSGIRPTTKARRKVRTTPWSW